jgi:uncharacterized protein
MRQQEKASLLKTIKIVEKESIPSNAIMLHGLPDVGLVGLIATSYMISELDLAEVAYVDTDLMPPVIVLHDGLPHIPLRIFGNNRLLAVISEIAIPANHVYAIMRAIIDWGQSKNVKMVLSIGGLPIENRQDLKEPKVFGAASNKELISLLQEKGLEILREGYMVGPQALTMRFCAEKEIPAIALLAQSYYNYPDPEAAAAAIQEVAKIADIKIDVTQLLQKGEEIRLRARDIMKRTQRELTDMKKSQEYDVPYVT